MKSSRVVMQTALLLSTAWATVCYPASPPGRVDDGRMASSAQSSHRVTNESARAQRIVQVRALKNNTVRNTVSGTQGAAHRTVGRAVRDPRVAIIARAPRLSDMRSR